MSAAHEQGGERRTVKVRVAVAVDPTGAWSAAGWGDDQNPCRGDHSYCVDTLEDGEARYWLTAELPIPEAAEVEASVEPAP